jgi:hypothetical protein
MSGRRMKILRKAAYGDMSSKASGRRYQAGGYKAPILVCVNPEYRAYKAAKQALLRQRIGGAQE